MTGETTLVAGMAGRYATALFELARDEGKLDETAAALTALDELLDESPDLARLVRSPIFSATEQAAALAALTEKAGIPPLTSNFLQLLVKNRRLFALRDIVAGFRTLLADHRGEIRAEVTSAVPLSDQQTDDLKATLKAKTGKDVSLTKSVDPALLGGLIVKIGSRMVDSSIQTKLSNMKIAMKEVG
ncbi:MULTISPECIES: F0F1 ATP synthase subunit delta [Rhodomicrobium]|uniref:F0F1 ATP synthase subunit delta n=2 Tax=Rhodomicrobium TaxID=1068 RepID=UPI000B4AB215|nr:MULTISPECIES: F0F1 ATP synthase subunit delta [Rhodomicrobium]